MSMEKVATAGTLIAYMLVGASTYGAKLLS